jgi:hypothetical protein
VKTADTIRKPPISEKSLNMSAHPFSVRFCQRFDCPQSQYEEQAFRELLHWQARPLVSIIRKLNPDYFDEDFKFIQYLGEATDFREAEVSVADFRSGGVGNLSFWRNRCKIRVSGRKAGRLVRQLFEKLESSTI